MWGTGHTTIIKRLIDDLIRRYRILYQYSEIEIGHGLIVLADHGIDLVGLEQVVN